MAQFFSTAALSRVFTRLVSAVGAFLILDDGADSGCSAPGDATHGLWVNVKSAADVVAALAAFASGTRNATRIMAITPSDTAQPQTFRAIVCLTSGNLVVKGLEADTAQTIPMTAGAVFSVLDVNYVMAASTGTYAGVY